jgi:hypothetical protein
VVGATGWAAVRGGLRPAPGAATMAPVTSREPVTRPQPCTRCGGEADFDIASLWLCVDCYHIAGSTCAGIGRAPADRRGPDSGDQVC